MSPKWYKWNHRFSEYETHYYRYVREDLEFAIRNHKIYTRQNPLSINKLRAGDNWGFKSGDWTEVELPKRYINKLKRAKLEQL